MTDLRQLALTAAMVVLAAGTAQAQGYRVYASNEYDANVTVIDPKTETAIGSIKISISKAWTSRAFDIATHDLAANAQPTQQFFGIHTTNDGNVAVFAGGVPLLRDGNVVGAIGVSGGSGDQDQAVAEAGAAAL